MKMRERLLLGGFGGITPFIAPLIIVNPKLLGYCLSHPFDPIVLGAVYLLGLFFQLVLLFILGAFWSYLHKSERNKFKIFQLGIVAPAIICGLINSTPYKKDIFISDIPDYKIKDVVFNFSLTKKAFANESVDVNGDTKKSKSPKFMSRLIDGFFARDVVSIEKIKIEISKIEKRSEELNKELKSQKKESDNIKKELVNCKTQRDQIIASQYESKSSDRELLEAKKRINDLESRINLIKNKKTEIKRDSPKIIYKGFNDGNSSKHKGSVLSRLTYIYSMAIYNPDVNTLNFYNTHLVYNALKEIEKLQATHGGGWSIPMCSRNLFNDPDTIRKCILTNPNNYLFYITKDIDLMLRKRTPWNSTETGKEMIELKRSSDESSNEYYYPCNILMNELFKYLNNNIFD
jgi:hypothetical protein